MISTPTTTVTILGGSESTNDWGDPIEGLTEIAARIPCAIHQQRRVVVPEGQQAAMTVRYWTGYLPNGTVIDDAQRLRDDRSGRVYLIDAVETPAHPAMPQDVQLDLRTVE